MQARQLRLNDILKKDEFIVDINYPQVADFTDNPELKTIMYSLGRGLRLIGTVISLNIYLTLKVKLKYHRT